jgi:LacI family transcriptional regulator
MSVTGFGNILLSEHFRVPLTTVRQPKFTLAEAAFRLLAERMNGQPGESRRLNAELILRESTAAAAVGK